jgi:hypothetical protein
MDMSVAALLGVCVLLFTISAWRPILMRPRPAGALKPVLFLTISSLLQTAFIALVWRQILTLDYSLKFATVGIPCCALAVILARRGKQQNDQPRGATVEASIGLAMWMFLITAH